MASPAPATAPAASLRVDRPETGLLLLTLAGSLDSQTTGAIWREATQVLSRGGAARLVVDASRLSYCDGAGIGLLYHLQSFQQAAGGALEIRGLAERFQRLLEQYRPGELTALAARRPEGSSLPEEIGRKVVGLWHDLRALIAFTGELIVVLLAAARRPSAVRWKDACLVAEAVGINALPIVGLMSFMIGLILAFQSAIPMRQFGADIFVANLVGVAHIRELGPLITAILVAGRSASAFAAELGTMRVNEEIDALTTMGLDPVRFLVTTRVIAAVLMIPVLTIISDLFGLVGGAVVFTGLGFTLVTYVSQLQSSVGYGDLLGGLAKSVVFGLLVAAIGCLRGLQTRTGPSAVGDSATRAVVSGIVLIILADAVFAVLFYYLGI